MKLELGQCASIERVLTERDVRQFADLAEDHNPLHLDSIAASDGPFDRPIVHGLLAASLISGLLGQRLPGPGTLYLSQSLHFIGPLFVGEQVQASVTVVHLRRDKPIATLKTEVRGPNGRLGLHGEAVVKFSES